MDECAIREAESVRAEIDAVCSTHFSAGGQTGSDLVARAIVVLFRQQPVGSTAQVFHLNGGPGVVVHRDRTPVLAMTLHMVGGLVESIHVVSNPQKLTAVAL